MVLFSYYPSRNYLKVAAIMACQYRRIFIQVRIAVRDVGLGTLISTKINPQGPKASSVNSGSSYLILFLKLGLMFSRLN